MNGLNGSVAVLTSSSSSSTITSIAETETVTPPSCTDPDATNNSINKSSINNNDTKATKFGGITQVITELVNEDRYTEHEEYSTGKKIIYFCQTDVFNFPPAVEFIFEL